MVSFVAFSLFKYLEARVCGRVSISAASRLLPDNVPLHNVRTTAPQLPSAVSLTLLHLVASSRLQQAAGVSPPPHATRSNPTHTHGTYIDELGFTVWHQHARRAHLGAALKVSVEGGHRAHLGHAVALTHCYLWQPRIAGSLQLCIQGRSTREDDARGGEVKLVHHRVLGQEEHNGWHQLQVGELVLLDGAKEHLGVKLGQRHDRGAAAQAAVHCHLKACSGEGMCACVGRGGAVRTTMP